MKGVYQNRLATFEDPDYILPESDAPYSATANAMPMLHNAQAPRGFYGARFFEQTLPLINRQSALVKNLNTKTGRSWDTELGKGMGAVFAPDDGVVEKFDDDELVIRTANGDKKVVDLYNKHPFNRHTMLQSKLLLKKGDPFKKGQVLASSNFTDDEGRMAMGANARIAVVPFEGKTMDDAAVISESFAERLRSDHANMIDLELDEESKVGKNHFVSLYPKKFTVDQLDRIGSDGFVKPGTILNPGDPIRLGTRPKSFRSDSSDVKNLSRAARFTRKDDSAVWDGDDPAEVLDVVRNRKGNVRVMVKYEAPARPGDKLTLRNGQKMTITEVLPDDRAPRGEDGKPMDLLLNQLGLPSRVNFASYAELILGKIAEKRGEAYTFPSVLPDKKSMRDFVEEEAAAHGVNPYEFLFDPRLGRNLDQPVTAGTGHVLKLHHTAGKKIRYRGKGSYDINHLPMKGGDEGGGAQRLSGLEMSVLQSSGARGVQKEGMLLRGEYRPEFWRAIRENRPPPNLDKPFVWDKFMALLQGSGVNPKDFGGGKLRLTPLTDRDIDAKETIEIQNGKLVNPRTLEPEVGGLFDPNMTRKQSWGKISLPLAMVNPAYESQVRTLLGLTQKQMDEILDS